MSFVLPCLLVVCLGSQDLLADFSTCQQYTHSNKSLRQEVLALPLHLNCSCPLPVPCPWIVGRVLMHVTHSGRTACHHAVPA